MEGRAEEGGSAPPTGLLPPSPDPLLLCSSTKTLSLTWEEDKSVFSSNAASLSKGLLYDSTIFRMTSRDRVVTWARASTSFPDLSVPRSISSPILPAM